MNLHTFKRGIHPPDGKALTNYKPIEILMPKEGALMVFPVSQHIGAPCEPIVQKGDRVLLGQNICMRTDTFIRIGHGKGHQAHAYTERGNSKLYYYRKRRKV